MAVNVQVEKVLFSQELPNLVLHVHIMPRPEEPEWEDIPGGNAASETLPHLTGTWQGGVPVQVTPSELFLPMTPPELFLAGTPRLPVPFSPLGPPPRTPPFSVGRCVRDRLRYRTPIETNKYTVCDINLPDNFKYVCFSRISDCCTRTVAISLEKYSLLQVHGLVKTNT